MRRPPAAELVANISPYSMLSKPLCAVRSAIALRRPTRTSPSRTLVGACPWAMRRGAPEAIPVNALTSVVVEPISATRTSMNIWFVSLRNRSICC